MKYGVVVASVESRRAERARTPVDHRVALSLAVGVRQISLALFGVVAVLAVADIVLQTIHFTLAPSFPGWDEAHKLFDLDREQSLPTWYSIVLLFLTAVALAVVSWREFIDHARYRWHWLGLVPVFLALSMDEQIMGHETATRPVRELLGLSEGGLLHWAWVIPAGAVVILLGLVYRRFVLDLPPGTRGWVILAATLFLAGAVGMEMLGGWIIERHGKETLIYEMGTSVEEILELAGSTLFLTVLLREIGRRVEHLTFRLSA